jgi:hypothetical protein
MKQGMLPFVVEVCAGAEQVTGRAGLLTVAETWRALGMLRDTPQHLEVRRRRRGASDADKIEDIVLLLASGGECVDDINVLRADGGFCRLLGRRLSSADALLNFLYAFHDDRLIERAQKARAPDQKAYIPEENEALQGLGDLRATLVRRVATHVRCTRATLDHDATIQESHKQQAQWHYKGGRGYQPVAVYWAELDQAVADQYRDGNVPAAMGNLPIIQRAFSVLPKTVTQYAFRADSACYEEVVLKWLADEKRQGGPQGEIAFTISADMGEDLRAICARTAEAEWVLVDDRVEETVACADVEFTPGDWPKNAQPLRYVAVRIRKKQGLLFAAGSDTKYLSVVSNRWEMTACDLLRWHWKKAGTIEHLHDVTKNELGAAVPPCSRFGANAAWYRLSLLTYNVLSAMKRLALPKHLADARPKRLRFLLLTIAASFVSHSNRLIARVGAEAERIADFIGVRARLLQLARSPPVVASGGT